MNWRNLIPFASRKAKSSDLPSSQIPVRDAPIATAPTDDKPIEHARELVFEQNETVTHPFRSVEEIQQLEESDHPNAHTNEALLARAREASASDGAASAVELWQNVISKKPDNPSIWKEAAAALSKFKAHQAADTILSEAVEQFPDALELWYEWGRSAMARRLPIEETRRWALMRNKFPNHVHGYLCGARLARKSRCIEEAETLLANGMARIGKDRRLLLEHANCAEACSDWAEAIRRWHALETAFGLDASNTASMAFALVKAGRLDDARKYLHSGLQKFPSDPGLSHALAQSRLQATDY